MSNLSNFFDALLKSYENLYTKNKAKLLTNVQKKLSSLVNFSINMVEDNSIEILLLDNMQCFDLLSLYYHIEIIRTDDN